MKATDYGIAEKEFRDEFFKDFEDSRDGTLKSASDAGTQLVRRRIHESSFHRLLQPFEPVPDGKYYERLDTDEPSVLCHMEPGSRAARSIPFSDTTNTAFYTGEKFLVVFGKISTPWYTKNVHELKTYSYDLRKVIADNGIRMIHPQEDSRLMSEVRRICGSPGGNGAAGIPQISTVAGPITRQSYKSLRGNLRGRMIPNGTFLANADTMDEFLNFDASVIGDAKAGETITDGLKAFAKEGGKLRFFEVDHISTLKNDIVANNEVWQFAPANFLGKAYVMEELRMYVEKKVEILRFAAWEYIGFTISNVAALHGTRFNYAG